MPVDIVKSIHIMTPQKTASGNDYNHSNIGKYAGTAAGVATGGHFLYTFTSVYSHLSVWMPFLENPTITQWTFAFYCKK